MDKTCNFRELYGWTQSLFFAIIQKPMEKSYMHFVEGTSAMLVSASDVTPTDR